MPMTFQRLPACLRVLHRPYRLFKEIICHSVLLGVIFEPRTHCIPRPLEILDIWICLDQTVLTLTYRISKTLWLKQCASYVNWDSCIWIAFSHCVWGLLDTTNLIIEIPDVRELPEWRIMPQVSITASACMNKWGLMDQLASFKVLCVFLLFH